MENKLDKNFVSRVNQLDVIQLDKEISKIIHDEFVNSLHHIAPGILVKYQAEINLLIDSSIWCLSIAKHLSTFGQHMLLISYNKNKLTKKRLILHYSLSILSKYLRNIAENKLIKYESLQKFIYYFEHLYTILSVINFFRFLKSGKYPTIIDLILRMDCITYDPGNFRKIGFDHMTRELIWAGFMEFFGTVLPLINYSKIRQFIKRNIPFSITNRTTEDIINATTTTDMIKIDLFTKCAECNERPTLPHKIDCGHIFCYYCIYENITINSDYFCPLCDKKVYNISRIERYD